MSEKIKSQPPRDPRAASSPWRRPTRRAFVAMIGAAAAALTARQTGLLPGAVEEPPRSTWTGTTRWIGHC